MLDFPNTFIQGFTGLTEDGLNKKRYTRISHEGATSWSQKTACGTPSGSSVRR